MQSHDQFISTWKTVFKCEIYARYLEYQPKPRPEFTSSVRPSTSLVRKENKAYLNFLLVPIIPIPEFLVGANYSNPNVDARNLSFKSDKNKSN